MTWRLAWRNLWRQPKRTLLTVGAMVFSNVLLVFMISMQVGMYGLMIDNGLKLFTGHLQIQAPDYLDNPKMRLTVADAAALAERVRGLDGVNATARATAFAMAASEERTYGVSVMGVEPQYEPGVSSLPGLVREGLYLADSAAAEIVIGKVLARNLKLGVGDELTLFGSGLDGSFAAAIVTVVGIFDSGIPDVDRSIGVLPLRFFQETFFMGDAAHAVVITAATLDDVPAAMLATETLVPAELVLLDWNQLEPALRQSIQADIGSSFFMYFILVVLVAFSVVNTQLMSVLERTREFGIVLALGLEPARLGRLVLLESALMGLLGVLFGALLGGLLTLYFSLNGFAYPGMEEMSAQFNLPSAIHPAVTPLSLFAGPLMVFAFTLLASVWPALRLRRLEPVAAMRAAG
ncbi:MAG: FtsX-like permease family protein [Pseudomonadota bacterium]